MKPAPIAVISTTSDRIGGDRRSPARATSPFRPRSLQSSQEAAPLRAAAFQRAARAIGAVESADRGWRAADAGRSRAACGPDEHRQLARRARSGQSRGDGGEACGGLRARARGRPSGSVGEARRTARCGSRGSPGSGCCRTYRVPAQRIREARCGPPRRLCRDRREGRSRSRSHSRAFPRRAGRQARGERAPREHRPPLRGKARPEPDPNSRPRAGAEPFARTDRRPAGRS